VFDSATVIDHATYAQPMAASDGVRFVLVNGRVALKDGEPTGVAGGRALRRTKAMPSRPLNVVSSPSLRAEAADSGRRISVDLARGTMRVDGAGATLEAFALGLVQTAPRWTSVTGMLRDSANGAELGFTLIVDESAGSLTLQIDGRPPLVARLSA
jgi:N-acyl-D-amino-acid deacylase